MVIKTDKIKYSNLKLLVALYTVFLVSFSLVIKNLYVFEKASASADLEFNFNFLKFCVAIIVVLFNVFVLSTVKFKDLLYAVLVLILVFFVFPSAVIFTNLDQVDFRIFLSHNILFWAVLLLGKIKLKFAIPKADIKSSKLILSIVVLLCMLPFLVLFTPYIDLNNLLLIDIYETRELVIKNIDNVFTNYTYSWLNRFIIPALLVFGLYFKNKITVLLSILALVFLFLCGANKVVFVGLIMVLVLYKYDYRKKMNYFLLFIMLLTLVSLFTALVFDDVRLMHIAIRRPIMLPGLLDVLYFDFFEGKHLYWAQSITGKFIEYPFDRPHSFMVGFEYFGKEEWNASNGIISEGFMNGGLIGVIINSLFVGIFFSIISQLEINYRFFGLIFLFMFSLVSSALTTVMLTHGGIVLLFLAIFVLRNTKQQMT